MANTNEVRRSARAESIQRAHAHKKAATAAAPPPTAKKVSKKPRKTAKTSARNAAAKNIEYEVSKIVNSKMEGKKRFYLIQWKGYRPKYNTWEPEANLVNSQDMIKAFKTKFPDKA